MVLVSDKPSNYLGILQTTFRDRAGHETRRSRPCRVRVIFRHLSQAAWMVCISRSSALNRGCQDLFQPCRPDRKHTYPACITIILSLQLFTPYGVVATAERETGALLAASTRDPSTRRPSRVYTAATPWLSHGRWSMQVPAMAGANWHVPARRCSRRGTMPVDAASRPRPGTAC